VRKVAISTVVVLALIGFAFAVLPFHLTGFPPEMWRPTSATHCSAPAVSAFRTPRDGGWFGYAPLTGTRADRPACKVAARRRLQYAAMFLLAAFVLAVAIRRARDEPGGPPPDPAVP
jgi:hypothetical protein